MKALWGIGIGMSSCGVALLLIDVMDLDVGIRGFTALITLLGAGIQTFTLFAEIPAELRRAK